MKTEIEKQYEGMLLREYLRGVLEISNGLLTKLKKRERAILINGEKKTVTYLLKEKDVLEIDCSDTAEDENPYLVPQNLPIEIIAEDQNMVVVNKPYNMPTHPSLYHHTDTLANALAYRYQGKPFVFRAVNRLDMDTSGVVVCAKNAYASELLSRKIRTGKAKKEYIAVVCGKLQGEGEIDAPIRRSQESIIKREVSPDGEKSLTRYRSLLSCETVSVILAQPITGRTHQLRVHFASIGHPILGDFLYGTETEEIKRQALHAFRITIDGIGTFSAEVPNDMKGVIENYFGKEDFLR